MSGFPSYFPKPSLNSATLFHKFTRSPQATTVFWGRRQSAHITAFFYSSLSFLSPSFVFRPFEVCRAFVISIDSTWFVQRFYLTNSCTKFAKLRKALQVVCVFKDHAPHILKQNEVSNISDTVGISLNIFVEIDELSHPLRSYSFSDFTLFLSTRSEMEAIDWTD